MSLPDKPNDATPPIWIAAFITHNLPEAHIVLGKLRAHDIPAMLHQEAGAAALGITYGNLGEVKVLVAPDDLERALALLDEDQPQQLEADNAPLRLIWQDDADEQ